MNKCAIMPMSRGRATTPVRYDQRCNRASRYLLSLPCCMI